MRILTWQPFLIHRLTGIYARSTSFPANSRSEEANIIIENAESTRNLKVEKCNSTPKNKEEFSVFILKDDSAANSGNYINKNCVISESRYTEVDTTANLPGLKAEASSSSSGKFIFIHLKVYSFGCSETFCNAVPSCWTIEHKNKFLVRCFHVQE